MRSDNMALYRDLTLYNFVYNGLLEVHMEYSSFPVSQVGLQV